MVVLTTRIFFRFNSIFFPVEWYSFAWQLMKFLQIIMSMYEVPTWGLSYSTSFTLFLFNPVNYPVKEILCPLYWLGGWGLERWRTWFKLTQYRSSRSGTQIQWDSDLGVSFHYPIPGRLPTISFVCFLPFPLSCLLYIPKHSTCLKINIKPLRRQNLAGLWRFTEYSTSDNLPTTFQKKRKLVKK